MFDIITIAPDFWELFAEGIPVWVALRRESTEVEEPSRYFTVEQRDTNYEVKAEDGSSATFTKVTPFEYSFSTGEATYTLIRPKLLEKANKLTSVGGNYVGTADGQLQRAGQVVAHAHDGDVVMVRQFASQAAVLTAGVDRTIRLWSTEGGEPVRTFVGHTGRITDCALVGKGRNFVTTLADGLARLWECGSGKCVYKFQRIDNHHDGANAVVVIVGTVDSSPAPNQFECGDKVMFVGYESGVIQQFHLQGHHQTLVRIKLGGGVTSLASAGDDIIAGLDNGVLAIWTPTTNSVRTLTFNERYAVSKVSVVDSQVILYNGPETLIRVDLRDDTRRWLVGLPEVFAVSAIEKSTVVGDDFFAQY